MILLYMIVWIILIEWLFFFNELVQILSDKKKSTYIKITNGHFKPTLELGPGQVFLQIFVWDGTGLPAVNPPSGHSQSDAFSLELY